jgi:sirohydrochlorin ferrochelatase
VEVRELGMEIGERRGGAFAFAAEQKRRRGLQAGMLEQQAGELGAGVAADAGDGGAEGLGGLGAGGHACASLPAEVAAAGTNTGVAPLRIAKGAMLRSTGRELGKRLGKEDLDALAQVGGLAGVGADDEDGVVSGDGADDFVELFVVERGGDGLGSAHGGDEDEQVLGLADFEGEVLQDSGDFRQVVFVFGRAFGGKSVAGGTFEEVEFADVARERGLGDVNAPGGELAAQGVLVRDRGLDEELANRIVALGFHAFPGG